jgi:hypothetical protein
MSTITQARSSQWDVTSGVYGNQSPRDRSGPIVAERRESVLDFPCTVRHCYRSVLFCLSYVGNGGVCIFLIGRDGSLFPPGRAAGLPQRGRQTPCQVWSDAGSGTIL